jgi:magnesium-transporting ATPase (P-type)
MENFFSTALSFPTIIFSVLLGFISVYWLLTIAGLFDIEFLDIDIDMDYGGEATPVGGVSGVMVALGLTGLPISIIVSFIILFAWLGTYLSSLYLLSFFSMGFWFWLMAIITMLASIIISVPITIFMTKPMKRFFKVSYATRSNDLLGEVCQVITSEVSDKFGEAELNKEGDHYIFQVRSKKDNSIKKGDDVILLEYDRENHFYLVKKY